jgi:succinate dehydrogenase / fumarate reductase, membrane anchor subunit
VSLLGGSRAWLLQRITAVYLGVYAPVALLGLMLRPPADYAEWVALFAHPLVWLATALFMLLLLLHAWIGLRDVMLDYLKPLSVRLTGLALAALFLVAMGLWALWILIEAVLQ